MKSIAGRLRGAIYLLQALKDKDPLVPSVIRSLAETLADVESFPQKYEPIRFALSALLHSVHRGETGNYYIDDSQVFVWAMDELKRLTEPTNEPDQRKS